MKIIVDENIPRISIEALIDLGHDVVSIHGTSEQGMTDELLWAKAQAEQRLMISADKGFTSHRDEAHWGVLIVRLRQPNERKIHLRVMSAMKQCHEADWPGLLVVMRDATQSLWRVK